MNLWIYYNTLLQIDEGIKNLKGSYHHHDTNSK
jgi:hypothetical protein